MGVGPSDQLPISFNLTQESQTENQAGQVNAVDREPRTSSFESRPSTPVLVDRERDLSGRVQSEPPAQQDRRRSRGALGRRAEGPAGRRAARWGSFGWLHQPLAAVASLRQKISNDYGTTSTEI